MINTINPKHMRARTLLLSRLHGPSPPNTITGPIGARAGTMVAGGMTAGGQDAGLILGSVPKMSGTFKRGLWGLYRRI